MLPFVDRVEGPRAAVSAGRLRSNCGGFVPRRLWRSRRGRGDGLIMLLPLMSPLPPEKVPQLVVVVLPVFLPPSWFRPTVVQTTRRRSDGCDSRGAPLIRAQCSLLPPSLSPPMRPLLPLLLMLLLLP